MPLVFAPVVDCGDLAVVANGNHNLTGTTFGFAVSYECMDGYRLVGVAERVCQEDGAWSGEAPSCQSITPSPTAVGKGLMHHSTNLHWHVSYLLTCM